MADIIDIANDQVAQAMEAALSMRAIPPSVPYTEPCSECGAEISPRRAALGYDTCIACATQAEQINRFYSGRGY